MLLPAMRGARFRRVIVNRAGLRIPFPNRFADRLRGTTVRAIERRGKYLVFLLSSGEALIMHLGMSGWVHVAAIGDRSREVDPHDHVIFLMSSGRRVVFNDPRRFGLMDLAAAADEYPALAAMGPEPMPRSVCQAPPLTVGLTTTSAFGIDASVLARSCAVQTRIGMIATPCRSSSSR